MEKNWTFFDRILRSLRISKIKSHIPSSTILCDLGCGGKAYLLKYFESQLQYGYGFDKDVPEETAKKYSVKKLMLESKIPLDNDSVDIVTMLASLEHFSNESGVLQEVRRILRPGGRVLITVPTEHNKPLLELLASLGVIDKTEIIDHKRYYSKSKLTDSLESAGFSPDYIDVRYWQFGLNLFAMAKK